MRTFRNFAPRCSTRRALLALSIALLCCLNAGCAKRVTYVNGQHKLTKLTEGQPAPHGGVLLSEEYLSEIFEALNKKQ